jgi:hypothetical protein
LRTGAAAAPASKEEAATRLDEADTFLKGFVSDGAGSPAKSPCYRVDSDKHSYADLTDEEAAMAAHVGNQRCKRSLPLTWRQERRADDARGAGAVPQGELEARLLIARPRYSPAGST